MSDETAKRRANRQQRRRERSDGSSAARTADSDGGGQNSEAGESSLGDLATDLLKRAASPTVLGAAAGAAAAARLTAKPKEQQAGRARGTAQRRQGGRAKKEAQKTDAEEQIVLEGQERTEEPLHAGLASAAQARAEPDEAEEQEEQEEPPPALGRSERGEAIRQAVRYAHELTGRDVDTVSGIERHEQGLRVTVEVVELKRIPSSTDVLASYELILDGDGDLIEYRRARRYYRNSTTEDRFA